MAVQPGSSREYQNEDTSASEADVSETPSPETSSDLQAAHKTCPTVCVICGDVAVGYHYGVASCNGCKTFFRRSILQERKYVCKKNGNCFETELRQRRCLCRACRLNRCVEMGMNPFSIQMTNEQRNNETMREILKKRPVQPITLPTPEQINSTSLLALTRLSPTISDTMSKTINDLLFLDAETVKFRNCDFNPEVKLFSLGQIVQEACLLGVAKKFKEIDKFPLETYDPALGLPKEHYVKDCGSGYEGFMYKYYRKNWLFYDLLGTIEYAKAFPFFEKLSHQERENLLRTVSFSCFNLSQAFESYKVDSHDLVHPDGTKPPSFLTVDNFPEIFRNGMPMARKIHARVIDSLFRYQMSKTEYVLLRAIVLCNAACSELPPSSKTMILLEQRKYAQTLLDHCFSEFSNDGPARFATIISLVNTLEHVAHDLREFRLLINVNQSMPSTSPLVVELIDLE